MIDVKSGNIVKVSVEPDIAFAVLPGHFRKKHNLSQNKAAKLLDMKNVYSYQRLEKKANPRLSTLLKIHEVFPDFPMGMIFVEE